MNEVFGLEDLFETLLRIEETGEKVYKDLAGMATDTRAQKLFLFLAGQERRHWLLYSTLKAKGGYNAAFDADYGEYVRALVVDAVHLTEADSRGRTYEEALAVGMQLEKDTLILLNEIGHAMGGLRDLELDVVQEEERRHLRMLVGIRNGTSAVPDGAEDA